MQVTLLNHTKTRISVSKRVPCEYYLFLCYSDNLMNFLWASAHEMWASPLLVIFCMIGLLVVLGLSSLIGLAVLICSLFATARIAHYMSFLQEYMMKIADKRMQIVTETISSIKLIKLYAWEKFQYDKIKRVRDKQEATISRANILAALNRSLGSSVPLFVSLSSFSCFVLFPNVFGHGLLSSSNTLDATTAFVSLLLFTMLREPLSKMPEALNFFIRCSVSIRRIETFLQLDERVDYIERSLQHPYFVNNKIALNVEQATFSWDNVNSVGDEKSQNMNIEIEMSERKMKKTEKKKDKKNYTNLSNRDDDDGNDDTDVEEFNSSVEPSPFPSSASFERNEDDSASSSPSSSPPSSSSNSESSDSRGMIKDISLTINENELCMIIGEVGSGKSTLIAALLGELQISQGKIFACSSSVAYTPQVSWLQSATIKQNIIFGLEYDDAKYQRTITACELRRDFQLFVDGDQTLVGERGINLSVSKNPCIYIHRLLFT